MQEVVRRAGKARWCCDVMAEQFRAKKVKLSGSQGNNALPEQRLRSESGADSLLRGDTGRATWKICGRVV